MGWDDGWDEMWLINNVLNRNVMIPIIFLPCISEPFYFHAVEVRVFMRVLVAQRASRYPNFPLLLLFIL